ncbi:hypothetical protein [Cryobacterium sp. PAMC25264]|uniref:hypothetical protein n=1 Tax=Cryobacterium sp. PAMC25264 TaxID=2861288 RepID=UPI001C62BD3E|nr:hypothetical protein [Cryobacterium sp. PAMC25264]QYF74078.1 hypothetical protein KY500_02155 [Cryobacterium sp. PAMC25264]
MSATRKFLPRLVVALAGVGLACGMLAGCAGATTALHADAASELQSGVLAVSTAAAAGDYTSAQTALDTLRESLAEASADDTVTAARAAEIQTAIGLVAADLASSIAASTPVETSPVETTAPEPVSTDEDPPAAPEKPKGPDKSGDSGKDKTQTGACEKKGKCD